ncbi:MAG: hypothetical protein HC850_04490 [Rhodomicrobium sp.]|nr:hypothetical protein [Rhodomicrobium sp.]
MSQLKDIVQKSTEMMNEIIAMHPRGEPRQALAWRLRTQVLELQKLHRSRQFRLGYVRFNYSIFISQSYDDDWTVPVRSAASKYLTENGIRPIIASKEVVAGPSIIARVLEMIQGCEGLLCILTPSKSDPLIPSSWQITEIAIAVAFGKPIGFLVENSVREWAEKYYGALYNLITCEPEERLMHTLDRKIEETMIALELEICSRHTEIPNKNFDF